MSTHSPVDLLRPWTKKLLRALRREKAIGDGTEAPGADDGFLALSRQLDRRRVWTRPGFVAVTVTVLVAAGFLIWRNRTEPAFTAASLLERATVVEQAVEQSGDRASHRLINLEERRSPEGAVVSRRRIEIWTNHATGDRAQRLYDENGWTDRRNVAEERRLAGCFPSRVESASASCPGSSVGSVAQSGKRLAARSIAESFQQSDR